MPMAATQENEVSSQPAGIKTNRLKAVIATNLQAVMQFSFICGTKIACNEKGVNAFDIVLFANVISLVGSTIFSLCTGKGFIVAKELRGALITRSVIGLIGLTAFTFGAVLIPITVLVTVGNLAPFFASLMAYLLIGEGMSVFEVIAMLVSFGGVIMIAIAQGK